MKRMSALASLPLPAADFSLPNPLARQVGLIDALYVHIPFCSTKCHDCEFYSLPGRVDLAAAFLDALAREIDLHLAFFGTPKPRTLFIGGGTPTLLPAPLLARLLHILHLRLNLRDLQEFTIEANPNTFDADKARILVAAGVNRISFGAQSFNPPELAMLQRDHDPASVPAACAIARHAGLANLNLDLIFGIPGQTLASWEFSLARALELQPTHLSCYSLIYEPNTPMTARLRQNDLQKIDEEAELAMFNYVYRRLRDAGFTRYETSNYARTAPPTPCQHNLIYWKAGNWLAFGPSAGSHMALTVPVASARASSAIENQKSNIENPVAWQWKTTPSLAHYIDALPPGATHLPITQMEPLTRQKWAAGAAVFWLRLNEGLNYQEFAARTGIHPEPALRRILQPYVELGFAELTPTAARITDPGVAVSDHILKRVLAALEQNP